MRVISKVLSLNDTAETGAHQAGILVPKRPEILDFFPRLDGAVKNPRVMLRFTDTAGAAWDFAFIYYNNRFFGGTRNEYRLTRMTPFLRGHGLRAGDTVILTCDEQGDRRIAYERRGARRVSEGRLRLGEGWKVIS